MSDRLTDEEMDHLERLARNPLGLPTARVHDAVLIGAPFLIAEVREHRAMRARLLSEHSPVEVEPSDTICGGCSTLRGSGDSLRYFPSVEWPCPVAALVDGDDR